MSLKRGQWIDVALIAVSCVFGGYLLATTDRATTDERMERANHLLQQFSPSRLELLTLKSNQDSTTLRSIEGQPGEYRLEGDSTGKADAAIVRELVSALQFATFKRTLETLPEQVNLDSPRLVVSLQTDRHRARLTFYGETPTSVESSEGDVYVQVNFDGTSRSGVTSRKLFTTLDRSKQEFRGPRLFPFSIEETMSISVRGDSQFDLVADELGFLVETRHLRADRSLVDILFFHLAEAGIQRFLDQTEAVKIVEGAEGTYTVVQRGAGKDVQVRLGGTCPGDETNTVAVREKSPAVAGCIKRSILAGLSLTNDDLVDRSATIFTSDEIDHVKIEGPQQSLDLLRKDAGFMLANRPDQTVPKEAGEEFLDRLSNARLELLPDAPQISSEPLRMTIVGNPRTKGLPNEPWLDPSDGPREALGRRLDLQIYPETPLVVHRTDDDAWLNVPAQLNWIFSQDDSWARPRKLDVPAPSELSWARIKMAKTRRSVVASVYRVRRSEIGFAFADSAPQPRQTGEGVDPTLARRFFDELGRLQAARFLGETTPLESAWCEIEFGTDRDQTGISLMVGQRVHGGFLAWSSNSQSRFVLPYETGITLGTPLFDRSPAQVEPDRFSALRLDVEGRSVRLVRVAGQFQPLGSDVPAETTPTLVEQIRGMRVLAHDPKRQAPGRALIRIQGTGNGDDGADYLLEVIELVPYQDDLAYAARVEGASGTFFIAAESVRALLVML